MKKDFDPDPAAFIVWAMAFIVVVACVCGAAALVRWTFF